MTTYRKSPVLGSDTGQQVSEESIRNESRLLKCVFKKPDILDHPEFLIEPEHFGHLGYPRLFRAMRSGHQEYDRILPGRCMHALRAGSGMSTAPSPDGCRFELMRLMTGFIDWWHWPYYAEQVRLASRRREMLQLSDDLRATALSHAEETNEAALLQRMEKIINE